MAMLHRNESLREFFQVEHAKHKSEQGSSQQDKEFNKQHDSTHRLGGVLHLRPKKKSASVHDQWQLPYQQNVLLLTFYMLIHILYADDHELDQHEQKVIRKLFKKSRSILTGSHFDQILTFCEKEITLRDVLTYVEERKIPAKMIQESLQELHKSLGKKQVYKPYMDELKKTL